MQYTAIIFDLFGTLVRDFSRTRYEDVYMRIAGEVHMGAFPFSRLKGKHLCRQFGISRIGRQSVGRLNCMKRSAGRP
jgi:hypothetical protein